jgi:membrane protein YdbS with pleckstrin-like domain
MGVLELLILSLPLAAVIWLVALFRLLSARRTRYTFRRGWLVVRHGVLFTSEKPYELTHLVDAKLTQGPLEQLTGNGKLHLNFDKHGTPVLIGFMPIDDLRQLRMRLNDVSRLLRSNPLLKGLVT